MTPVDDAEFSATSPPQLREVLHFWVRRHDLGPPDAPALTGGERMTPPAGTARQAVQSRPEPLAHQTGQGRSGISPLAWSLLLAAGLFILLAPSAATMDLPGGMEHYNVATALEVAREHHWLIPTLYGMPRAIKPPLTEWITALGILSGSPIEWGSRWPTLLMAAFTLPVIYLMGSAAGDKCLGLAAAIIAASSFFFLKFARNASYDSQLMLWVSVTDAFLLMALVCNRWWIGSIGAGAALGLALMTKGPPALVLTVLPVVVATATDRLHSSGSRRAAFQTRHLKPILLGSAITLLLALPWPLYVLSRHVINLRAWYDEVALTVEGRYERRIGWINYLGFFLYLFPWSAWCVAGAAESVGAWFRFRADPVGEPSQDRLMRLMLCWVLIPLVVMGCFPERRDRYILPLLGPGAVLAATAMVEWLRGHQPIANRFGALVSLQWLLLAAPTVGLPLYGAVLARTVDGEPWFSPAQCVMAILIGGGLLVATVLATVRFRWALLSGTLVVMIFLQALFLGGYSQSRGGRSGGKELTRQILAHASNPIVYNLDPYHRPLDLYIYLNRLLLPLSDIGRLRPSNRDQVVLVYRDRGQHIPATLKHVGSAVLSKSWWDAYELPAARQAAPPTLEDHASPPPR